jgi:hypothetical protein
MNNREGIISEDQRRISFRGQTLKKKIVIVFSYYDFARIIIKRLAGCVTQKI